MKEIWTQGLEIPRFPQLDGDTSTEVLVIGGGMAGILCARELQSRGIECLLVEGNTIGSGITSGTTAVLSTLHDPLYQDLSARFGQEPARLYFLANWEALEKYRTLARRCPCDFQDRPHYRYAMTQVQAERLKTEAELLQRLGFTAEYRKETPLPFPVAGAVYLPGMAQFHPLRFLYGLASSLKIRENTPVLGISNGVAFTERGKILARKIIVATHFPLGRFRGLYFMKLYQRRSYVIALGDGPDVEGTYAGMGPNGISLRNFGAKLCRPPFSRASGAVRLGQPGLHDPGRSALCGRLQPPHAGFVCGYRIWGLGYDKFHGSGNAAGGPGDGQRQSVYRCIFPRSLYAAAPAIVQSGPHLEQFPPSHPQTVFPHGLRPQMESSRAQLGLSLPRIPVHGRWRCAGQPGSECHSSEGKVIGFLL